MNPKVSILIPTYNREKIIAETLESAINQTYKNIEIIIVDNCSTDNTYLKVKDYSLKDNRIKLYRNNKNIGPVKNWKKCIEFAKGEFIKILWSDDLISLDFVERTLNVLKNNNEIAFVYTKTRIFSSNAGKNKIIREVYRFGETGKYILKDFVKAHLFGVKSVPVSPGNALFRKKDVERNLLINIENPKNMDFSRFGAGNDLLLFLMTSNKYKYFYFIDNSMSFFRSHKDSFSESNDLTEYYTYSMVYFLHVSPKYKKLRKIYYADLYFFKKDFRYMVRGKLKNRYLHLFMLIKFKLFIKLKKFINKNRHNI